MPKAKINGIEINYELEGDGPETIVLVNGLADDIATWFGQRPAFLEKGYRVLCFDNRGIGKSERPPGPYTTTLMATDAKGIVDHLGITGFHLVGVSMGGMISQEYALAHPGDLKSLSLCCTYAAPGPFCSRMFKLWQDMAPVMGVPTVMRDVTLWAFTQDFFLNHEDTLREFEAAMAALEQPVEAYLAQLNAIQVHDTRDRLPQLKVPTLVLAGADDILIPMNRAEELHSLIPGAEFATAKGGHAFLWEYPEPFNDAVLGFIGKHHSARD